MLFQWRASVKYVGPTVLGEWHVFGGVLPLSIQQTRCSSIGVLGQCRRRLVGIELAMGCDAGPILKLGE